MMYRMSRMRRGWQAICILSTMVMVMVSTTVCMFAGLDDEINMLYPYEINVQTGYSEVKENVSEQSSDIIQFIEDTGTNVTDSESYSYLNFAMTLEKDSHILRLTSVRNSCRVSKVYDIFIRKLPGNLPRNRKSAHSGIKNSDRRGLFAVHLHDSLHRANSRYKFIPACF